MSTRISGRGPVDTPGVHNLIEIKKIKEKGNVQGHSDGAGAVKCTENTINDTLKGLPLLDLAFSRE